MTSLSCILERDFSYVSTEARLRLGEYMIASPSTEQPLDTEPTIEVTWPETDVALVVLAGEQDMGSAPVVEGAVSDALRTCSHLVIDLSAVQFVDSSIISLLIQMRRE